MGSDLFGCPTPRADPTNEESPGSDPGLKTKEGRAFTVSTAMVDVPLFEGLEVPQILPDDSARARRSDPVQSHMAADRSAKALPLVRQRVLRLVAFHGPRVSGNTLNELYVQKSLSTGWDVVHFDSPRKRAGDLARIGLLKAERNIDGRTLSEAVYTITDKGMEAIR